MAMPSRYMQVWWRFSINHQNYANSLWYQVSGTMPGTFSNSQLSADIVFALKSGWQHTANNACIITTNQIFFFDGTLHRQFFGSSGGFQGVSASPAASYALCGLLKTKTAIVGRSGAGRVWLPPTPLSYIVDGRLTSTAVGNYQLFANALLTPIVSQSLTFTFSLHSLQDNDLKTVTSIAVHPRATTFYRRRQGHRMNQAPPVYPNVP